MGLVLLVKEDVAAVLVPMVDPVAVVANVLMVVANFRRSSSGAWLTTVLKCGEKLSHTDDLISESVANLGAL